MRRQLIWMIAAGCAATFSAGAGAPRASAEQPPPHAQGQGQDNKDKNKDKDKDKDKKAKKSKAPQGTPAHGELRNWDPRFHGLDTSGNGIISRDEWNGDNRSFSNHDWNKDGVLSGDELVAGATRPNQPRDPRNPGNEPDEVLFARMDANRDNSLSRSEWNGTPADFERLDSNKDGVLSPYEFGVGR